MDRSKQAFPVPLEYSTGGMTLREYAAVAAMQGMCHAANIHAAKSLAECAVVFADALLARLEESSNG